MSCSANIATLAPCGLNMKHKWLLSLFAIALVILHPSSMAQCTNAGGTISTATTDTCSLQSGTLTITSTGSITSSSNAVNVYNTSVTGVINDGTINAMGNSVAISNITGTIGTFSNSGQITSFINTIFNSGNITDLSNTATGIISLIGTMSSSSSGYSVLYNQALGTIGTFTNSGQITSNAGFGIVNHGNIINLENNSGTIFTSHYAIYNTFNGTVGILTNSGQITSSGSFFTLVNEGVMTHLTNSESGTISNIGNGTGILNEGSIGSLINDGTIVSSSDSQAINNEGAITDFTNSATGTVSASNSNAFANRIGSTIGTFTNSGQFTASGAYSVFSNYGTITNFNNSATGVISNTASARAIYNDYAGIIQSFTNDGVIGSSANKAIFNYGTINNMVNSGTISSLVNLQGASSSALSLSGRLPTLYGIVIDSTTNYGKLSVTNPGQSIMTFGIYGNPGSFPQDFSASTITSGTYSSVLTGLSSSNISSSSLSGTYPGGYTWQLVNAPGSTTTWDLVVMSPQIGPGSQTVNGRVGTAITNTVVLTGADFIGNVSYTIAPNLPAGLTLDNSTGVISGTPTMAQSASSYTITGTGATSGMATSTVSIEVAEIPVTENAPIPTLNEWAMILLVSLMGVFGFDRQRLFKRLSFKQACQRQRRSAQR